jgi:predicted nucleic acid-binding protein
MIALDTPVLLDLLRGAPAAKQLIRSLRSEEVATTELNLWELGLLALEDRRAGRERRLAALERLRRRLVVLPVDSPSVSAALRVRRSNPVARSLTSELIVGVLEAHGCTEWVTAAGASPRRTPGSMKVVEYADSNRKNAKSRS